MKALNNRILNKCNIVTALYVTLICVFYGDMASAQIPRLLTTQHGLNTSDIRSIDIDSRGMAWISGPSTLEMFDGNQFYEISLKNDTTDGNICDVVNGIDEIASQQYLVRTNNGLYHYDLLQDKFTPVYISSNEMNQERPPVGSIHPYVSQDKRLVITEGSGVYVLDINTFKVDEKESAKIEKLLDARFILKAITDSKGRLWICDISTHLKGFDITHNKQIKFKEDERAHAILSQNNVESICDAGDYIYFGTREGVLCYNEKTNTVSYVDGSAIHGAPIVAMLTTTDNRLLLGTDGHGLWDLRISGMLKRFEMTNAHYNIDYGKVKCMVQDKDGNILIGLMQKGLMVIPPHSDTFRYHTISPTNDNYNASCITAMTVDDKLNYWIGTDGCGVFKTDGLHLATAHPVNDGLSSLLIQSVQVDKRQTVWVGSYGGGVQYFDGTRFVTHPDCSPLRSALVMALAYDKDRDRLYIGGNGSGVFFFDIQTGRLNHPSFSSNVNPWITALHVGKDGKLFIGTSNGLWCYDSVTKKDSEIKCGGLRPRVVSCIVTDENKLLFGTSEGLGIYDIKTGDCTKLIDNERIKSIEQTQTDYWIATSRGIISIDKKTLDQKRYSSLGGFFMGEFHANSSVHPVPDDILFGGDNGIVCFTPSLIKQKKAIGSPLLFNELRIGDEVMVAIPEKIKLDHDHNSFLLAFSVPQFSAPERIHYSYMLEGFDKDWRKCEGSPEVTYSSLPSGNYTLRVRAYNESDTDYFQEREIDIKVLAPWYASFWAWMCYLLIIGTIGYFFYKAYVSRKKQRKLLRIARENEEMKEARLKMFTSITHELRTPLTMIVSPLKQLSTSYKDESIQSLCDTMKRNCDRLLNIVKQITDIRHIDSGQLRLRFKEVDFINYSENIYSAFSANAKIKHISFISEHTDNVINIWLDPVHFEKIIVNLLSNAFKFTPEGGKIIVRSTICHNKKKQDGQSDLIHKGHDEYMELRIYNSGSHIKSSDLPHIFDRFYQCEDGMNREGSGIGLNLVAELVALHHGKIYAHNVEPEGVEFILNFPLGNSHLSEEEMAAANEPEEPTEEQASVWGGVESAPNVAEGEQGNVAQKKQTVLIVDDDKELCEYIANELGKYYNILVAFGGNSAWQIVLKQRPDAIVTDVKMDDGDGTELCKRIKNNPETDNIPIIMLTGESSDHAQIQSLNLQVDYFLSKPFNLMVLRGAIGQVLRVRENLRQRISRKDLGKDYDAITIDSADNKLFNKINDQLLKHIDDAEFGVERLAEQVGISRVHLNRKMKERYGLSPRQYIKSFRLKQAAYLLIHNHVNVSEVVYKLGFSSHSFFTSSFHEYFGMSPKEFVAYYSQHPDDETLQKLLE